MYHVGAREYDPRTARWLQRDPIDAASGDPNLYRYCGNDPLNFTDVDGADKEEKQPNQSAGKKAEEKVKEKVAFICVGNTDIGVIGNFAFAVRQFIELRVIQWALEAQGYTVKVDRDCTEQEALAALRDDKTAVFVFFGHANETELGMVEDNSDMTDDVLDTDDVRAALGGRRLERVYLWGCNTESEEWRTAFGNPAIFDGSKGTYNPVYGIDFGNLLGKKPEKPKDRQQRKKPRGVVKKH
ncbi:MAG: hypothetical protein KatS3mg054_1079 [Chloroflexus sp.]|nr:MAG: hypothetical protein KatS3mg054_1079 [Chloroflexus sp.]